MSRLVAGFGLVLVAAGLPAGAYAADWDSFGGYGLRGSVIDYDDAYFEPLGFELGVRYWHSLGATTTTITGSDFASEDRTQILEGHFRIDDYSTGWFLKGLAGHSVAISGEYVDGGYLGTIIDGRVGYAGADLAYAPFGDLNAGTGIGVFGGYHYWHDNPDVGRANFTVAESADDITWSDTTGFWSVGFDSEPNAVDIHALRLGVAGRLDLGFMDITAEVAAVPYAWVGGTLGAHGTASLDLGDATLVQSSATTLDGQAYGAMAEAFLGFRPTENIAIRLGGRAWYLEGTYDARYSVATIVHPADDGDGGFEAPLFTDQGVIVTDNPFSLLRLGGLVELTASF